MSLDLGGPALEIAIALSFVFFLLSLIVTAVNEWVSGLLNLRAKTLRKGLVGMLGDGGVAESIVEHPLVRTDHGQRQRDPSYISPRQFALAFQDVVEPGAVSEQLAKQLQTITGAPGGALPGQAALEKWFDESMERVSGWYKRKAQIAAIAIAVVVTLALNVSALPIAEHLSNEPTVRAAVVAQAEKAEAPGEESEATEGEESQGASELRQAGEDAQSAVSGLAALKLPIFWDKQNVPWEEGNDLTEWIFGWLVTIIAISLGAPFWFDALGKLSNLRMAGKKPEEKAANAP
jgi:hypothetical protein